MLYNIDDVRPIKELEITAIGGEMAEDIKLFLNRAARYCVKNWWRSCRFKKYNKEVYIPYINNTDEHLVNMANYSRLLSTMLKFDLIDEDMTGSGTQSVQDKCIKIIRSLCRNHSANMTGGWSMTHVASTTAAAGYLIFDKLNDKDKLLLINMLEYEANRIIDIKVPFQYNYEKRTGNTSKAKIACDYIDVLNIAIAMLPDNIRSLEWRIKQKDMQACAFSNEQDGLGSWNTETDGTVKNGNYYDVNSMCAVVNNMDAIAIASLADETTEDALRNNALRTYDSFINLYISRNSREWIPLFDRTYNDQPKAQLNLPKNSKGAANNYACLYAMDVLAYCNGYSGGNPREWANVRMKHMLYMQSRHANYSMYGNISKDHRANESNAAKYVSIAYLSLYLYVTGQY